MARYGLYATVEIFHRDVTDFLHIEGDGDIDEDNFRLVVSNPGTWMAEMAAELIDPEADLQPHWACQVELDHFTEELEGYYWWVCHQGCMPDSDAHGPFESEEAAHADAVNEGALPMPVKVSVGDGVAHYPEGWELTITFYTSKRLARRDQSIMDSRWEIPGDMTEAYAVHLISREGEHTDEEEDLAIESLLEELRDLGYEPELMY